PSTAALVRDGVVRSSGDGSGASPVRVEKAIRVGGGRLDPVLSVVVGVTNTGHTSLTTRVAVAWSTMLLGGGGNPSAWYEVAGNRIAHDAAITAAGVDALAAGNDFL